MKRRRKTRKAGADDKKTAPAEPTSPDELAERKRRRKATLNRVINALEACLNYAQENGKVSSKNAWERLRKFRSADSARLRWLTIDEATRLQAACSPDLRSLVRAALLTGCRAGELLAVQTRDFDSHSKSKTLLIPDSKSGKSRRVPLTDDGVALFVELTAGRPGARNCSYAPMARAGIAWPLCVR